MSQQASQPFHRTPLSRFDLESLAAALREAGYSATHAKRILRPYYDGNGRIDLCKLPVGQATRQHIQLRYRLGAASIAHVHQSADGSAKCVVHLGDGRACEAVYLPGHREGEAAACLSTQIGCPIGCDFCASTRGGLVRSLDDGEIVEQFLLLRGLAADRGRRLRNIVFMGSGEPLLNLNHLLAAIRRIGGPLGGLGWKQITVSTVGIVPGIDSLAAAGLTVQLALSLHAPDDATRSRIVPVNRRYPVAEIVAAAGRYQRATGQVVNIEYCLLREVNDSDEHARQLATLLDGLGMHVNLIPYNTIGAGLSGRVYQRPTPQRIAAFLDVLRGGGVQAHIRATRGDDISAACGQLVGGVQRG